MRIKVPPQPIPVRDIGVGTRGVTGVVPSFGKYESSLERDLMEILRFDLSVDCFEPQPFRLEYEDRNGKLRTYTPDGLIHFKEIAGSVAPPILYEVKYRDDFRLNWKVLMPKFRAAKAYGLSLGWRFEVFTEREIRTPYLNNVKFLLPYRGQEPASEDVARILQALWDLEVADPDLILCALCHDATNRARLIPVLWHLIANGSIGCDLTVPLNMLTPIWAEKDC